MSFAALHRWWLLLLVPGLVFFLVWAFRERQRAISRFVDPILLERLLLGISMGRRRFKAVLLVLATFFIALACLQPRWGFHWEEIQSRGVDIFVAVDVSKSMLAEDVSPNRLERAKRKVLDLLRLAQGDRIGLIAFAGRSYVQCPLTLDYSAIATLLQPLGPDSISVPGTNVGEAIDQAFQNMPEKSSQARALILLTDGENLEGDPNAAAKRAKERGLYLYAIGIGKDSGAPIPGGEGGFKKDRSGELVLTKLDEASLQSLVLSTGGSYVRSVSDDADLNQILKDIHHQLEDKDLKSGRRQKMEERFQWPLLLGLFCLFLELCFSEVPRRALFLGLFVLACRPGMAAPAFSEARAGEQAYNQGKYDEAIEHFLNAQVEDPSNERLRYDLANSYYKAGKYEQAEKLFSSQDKQADPGLRQKALYNLGNTDFRRGNLEDAIKHYEQALQVSPNDEDTQHNLQVVKKQLQQKQQQSQSDKDQKDSPKDPKDSQDQKDQKDPKDPKNSQNQNSQDKPGQSHPPKQPGEKEKSQTGQNQEKKDPGKGEEQKSQAQQAKPGDEKKDAPPASAEADKKGEMGKEEAQMWLSRLNEQRARQSEQRKQRDSDEVEKDW